MLIFTRLKEMLMQPINSIRVKAGKRLMGKVIKGHIRGVPRVCNLNEAKSIALLFKISNETELKKVIKFEKLLKEEYGVRNVFALGYCDEKTEPDFLRSGIGLDYILKKDLNWKGVPSGNTFKNFVQKEYDILIDFTNYFNVPLRFTLLRSLSKFKIGKFSEENTSYYDLMIDSKNDDFEEFADQVVHYLEIINAK